MDKDILFFSQFPLLTSWKEVITGKTRRSKGHKIESAKNSQTISYKIDSTPQIAKSS
jgi:hypothetical protein